MLYVLLSFLNLSTDCNKTFVADLSTSRKVSILLRTKLDQTVLVYTFFFKHVFIDINCFFFVVQTETDQKKKTEVSMTNNYIGIITPVAKFNQFYKIKTVNSLLFLYFIL